MEGKQEDREKGEAQEEARGRAASGSREQGQHVENEEQAGIMLLELHVYIVYIFLHMNKGEKTVKIYGIHSENYISCLKHFTRQEILCFIR